jgi:hypothetical protein
MKQFRNSPETQTLTKKRRQKIETVELKLLEDQISNTLNKNEKNILILNNTVPNNILVFFTFKEWTTHLEEEYSLEALN